MKYLAKNAQNPTPGNGLFNGTYAVLGQVNYQASRAFGLGLTYVHSYYGANDVSAIGSTGSYNAAQPFGNLVPTSANAYGVEASYRVSPFLTISGWGGLTYATAERGNGSTVRKGNHATSYNYAVSFAFPDLGKKGNLAAIIFGQPPKATRNDSTLGNGTALRRRDKDSAYHIEGLYRYQVTNNISITPGFFIILNPENNRRNSTEYIGIIRTTFVF